MRCDSCSGPRPGPKRPGRGRNHRSVDALANRLRDADVYDEYSAAVVTLARTLAASLDRMERNPDRSEHTVATVARVQLELLRELKPGESLNDPFDELTAALNAALYTSADA